MNFNISDISIILSKISLIHSYYTISLKFLTELLCISTNTTIIVMYFRSNNLNKNYIQKIWDKYIKILLKIAYYIVRQS